MTNPTIRIHNTETDEVIDREMTDEEFAVYQSKVDELAAQAESEVAKATSKTALLERLGITEEEANLLLA